MSKTEELLAEAIEGKLPGYRVLSISAAIGFWRTHKSCNECRWEATLKTPEGWPSDIWSDETMTNCLNRDFVINPNEGYSFHKFWAVMSRLECPDCKGVLSVSKSQKTDWLNRVIHYRCQSCKGRYLRQGDAAFEPVRQ